MVPSEGIAIPAKALKEAEVILAKETQIGNIVQKLCQTLHAQPEGEAGVFFWVYVASRKYLGVYHTAAEHFYPTSVLAYGAASSSAQAAADIHLSAHLCKGKVRGSPSDGGTFAEKTFQKVL